MKVLICVSEYFPQGSGIANVVFNIVQSLKKMGVECVICSPIGPDIKIITFNNAGRLGLLYFWNNVARYFSGNKAHYDVIWLHNPLFPGKIPFNKCIITMHTTALGQVTKKIYPTPLHIYKIISTWIEAYSMKKLDSEKHYFTAITSQIKDETAHLVAQDVGIISNGVDTTRFKPPLDKAAVKRKFTIPPNAEVFLSVGRLTEMKRPFEMLEIFQLITQKRKNALLLVAGKGELFESFSHKVAAEKIQNVIVLGFVHESDLPDLYGCADYYWSTSKYEGQPLTLLEAMATGLPCIVPDIPSFSVVRDADCGIMVDYTDHGSVAISIVKFLNDDISKKGGNARRYSVKFLDWDFIAQEYLKIFQYVLE